MNVLTPTQLRKNIYSVLDNVVASGQPQIVRKGKYIFEISAKSRKDIILSMPNRNAIVGDPDDLINLPLAEWDELKNL